MGDLEGGQAGTALGSGELWIVREMDEKSCGDEKEEGQCYPEFLVIWWWITHVLSIHYRLGVEGIQYAPPVAYTESRR